MTADAWALLAVSAVVIWGGLAASVVWLIKHQDVRVPFDDPQSENPTPDVPQSRDKESP